LHMNAFAPDESDEWSVRAGSARRKQAFRTRDLLNTGATLALGVFAFVVSACSGSFQDMHDHFPAPPAITNTSAYASSLM